MTARGGFTADLGDLLDAGAIDLAVHSWKDLPLPAGRHVRCRPPCRAPMPAMCC
ncbi:MAG: hypothetical protein R3E65_11645 [Steroidobacteraceae bacterium]